MIFATPEDIANRGLQHLGAPFITSIGTQSPVDNNKNAVNAAFVYDKCRRAELRANLWNFSARRLVLRPFIRGVTQVWFPTVWTTATVLGLGGIVSYNGLNWINPVTVPLTGQTPGVLNPFFSWAEFFQPVFVSPFVLASTYYQGELVASNGLWVALLTTTKAPGSPDWLSIPGSGGFPSRANAFLFTPQGITTNTLSTPKPAYPLPNGYLRVMPQDAKSPATPAQLSTAGMQNSDYEFEGGFLYTNSTKGNPIVFRFAADVRNVYWFDDLFSEMVACRIALELCETITQSAQKRQQIHGFYEEYLEKAQRVNAIEAGSTEPDTADVKTNLRPAIEKAPPPQPPQR